MTHSARLESLRHIGYTSSMGRSHKPVHLFAALRRDRRLFALVASLVLLTHLFQPLAEANAASTAKAWVICSMLGMASPDGDRLPPAGNADQCPTCIGGPCAGMAALPRAEASSEAAFPAPAANRGEVFAPVETKVPPDRLNEPPPAIRAPPFLA